MYVDSPLVYIYSIGEVQIFRRQIGRDEPLWVVLSFGLIDYIGKAVMSLED